MPDQEFKIKIISEADNTGFKSSAAAAGNLDSEVKNINTHLPEGAETWRKYKDVLGETEHAMGSARQRGMALRQLLMSFGAYTPGMEQVAMGHGGFLSTLTVGAVAAGIAIRGLAAEWDDLQETINGPIKIGLPDDAANKISAVATAWDDYAKARARAIEAAHGADASAGIREKQLNNELKLIKEVLAAEKEKAFADLALNKDKMTPEAYAAARSNINNIFDEAGNRADEHNRRQQIANKYDEAYGLDNQAREKMARATAIKAAAPETAAANQKALDQNAADAEKARKIEEERLALIERQRKSAAGQSVPEYEGAMGKMKQWLESLQIYERYGPMSYEDMRKIEQTRVDQAQANIDRADTYRRNQQEGSAERSRLVGEAASDSAKAAGLREEAGRARKFESQQNSVDSYVAGLHRDNTQKIVGANRQTAGEVRAYTDTILGGFRDIQVELLNNRREINAVRAQIKSGSRRP